MEVEEEEELAALAEAKKTLYGILEDMQSCWSTISRSTDIPLHYTCIHVTIEERRLEQEKLRSIEVKALKEEAEKDTLVNLKTKQFHSRERGMMRLYDDFLTSVLLVFDVPILLLYM